MYTKDQLDEMYKILGKSIDISDDLFDDATKEYQNLGNWLDRNTPEYSISVYPQGSFALGTVVKPITEKDEYDLDLVCEFDLSYGLTARQLKVDIVKPLLINYRRITGDIIEKRRCWHVEYDEVPNFHMDVIPAVDHMTCIDITDHDEEADTYSYLGSNPKGYVNWFFEQCKKMTDSMYDTYVRNENVFVDEADVEKVKRYKIKTPLQRAVQLLKRHRDIMFDGKPDKLKPISIIITTIAGQLYDNEDNIYDALDTILSKAERYITDNMKGNQYYIENPSFPGENFADKWNEHPERANEFIKWIIQARKDLTSSDLLFMKRSDMAKHIKGTFGITAGTKVFTEMAKADSAAIKSSTLKVDTKTGSLSSSGTIAVPQNHHHGNQV